MARLAIIPARSGSKRIPNKNVKLFHGRPVIAYSLAAARSSGLFDMIHVSTDSEAIAEIAADLGAPVDFFRPSALANDTAPLRDVLRFVRDRYRERAQGFDCICRLSACAPLMEASDLVAAEALFARHGGHRAVTAVYRTPGSLQRAYSLSEEGILEPLHNAQMMARSQDLAATYQDAGSFAFLPSDHLSLPDSEFYRGRVGYVLPFERAIDIDDPADWRLAELIYAGRQVLGGESERARQTDPI
jgi:N-acylneuraminate cytidylyltransferase